MSYIIDDGAYLIISAVLQTDLTWVSLKTGYVLQTGASLIAVLSSRVSRVDKFRVTAYCYP